ncbi:MAG: helix-turn-helix transcriptional regulator [Vicinamibacterales bacterium]
MLTIPNLRRVRRWLNVPQAALADLIGTSTAFISLVESGRRPISRERATQIAQYLGVSLDVLVGISAFTATIEPTTPKASVSAHASDRFARYRAATGREA